VFVSQIQASHASRANGVENNVSKRGAGLIDEVEGNYAFKDEEPRTLVSTSTINGNCIATLAALQQIGAAHNLRSTFLSNHRD
jgi:hypothetical protein